MRYEIHDNKPYSNGVMYVGEDEWDYIKKWDNPVNEFIYYLVDDDSNSASFAFCVFDGIKYHVLFVDDLEDITEQRIYSDYNLYLNKVDLMLTLLL